MKGQKILDYVDPFFGNGEVGTPIPQGIAAAWNWRKAQNGNTHPGAARPFGMASICAYSGAYPTGYGVYDRTTSGPPKKIFDRKMASGFTHFHLNGCGDLQFFYNYFRFVPTTNAATAGELSDLVDEKATPGYYACRLPANGVDCQFTVSKKAAYHRYQFDDGKAGSVFVDFASGGINIPDFPQYRVVPEGIELLNCSNGEWEGKIRAGDINIYFYLCSKNKLSAEEVVVNNTASKAKNLTIAKSECDVDKITGIKLVQENIGEPFEVVIGFSLKSSEQAKANSKSLLNSSFAEAVEESKQDWLNHLGRIEIEPNSEDDAKVFYSCLYHSLIKPMDCGDESPWWDNGEPFVTDFITLWDQYKTQLPLVTALFPETGRRMAESILKTIETYGYFPVAYYLRNHFGSESYQASGLGIHVLADCFFSKLLTMDDWPRIKKAIDAEFATSHAIDFIKNGKTTIYTHTIDLSCAAEAAASMAKQCGDEAFAEKMTALSHNWRNVYDKETGVLADGSVYYEGTKWNYSFRPHPDMAERIELAGGKEQFVKLLDTFFGYDDISSGVIDPKPSVETFDRIIHNDRFEGLNNEPDMEAPYAYLWADRPDRTSDIIQHTMKYQFAPGENGLPGNNDTGALSSWFVWNAIGIYPLAGTDRYLIASPMFKKSVVHFKNGDLTIKTEKNSHKKRQKGERVVEWNGEVLDRFWLSVEEIENGGELKIYKGKVL